jgi:glycosyltransferase involved in cell wall biosynthesis
VFHPALAGERHGEADFRILYVGRLHELKNIDLLLGAVAALRGDGVAATVDLVGDGPAKPGLEVLAQTLGLAAHVTWHGWRSKDDVAELYRHATCFVNPSRYEGMPNTVLEAMASGLPVVASDVGGNNDLVVHGETGMLFDLSDAGALARELGMLAANRPLGRRLGTRGRDLAVSQYSWEGVARRYLELFPLAQRDSESGRGLDAALKA